MNIMKAGDVTARDSGIVGVHLVTLKFPRELHKVLNRSRDRPVLLKWESYCRNCRSIERT
jgi:hypothetical protein